MKQINTQLNFWVNLLLTIGIISLFLLGYLVYQRYNPQNLSFNIPSSTIAQNSEPTGAQPKGLIVNSLNLSLNITPSQITNNKWEASTTGVSYLKTSVVPGQKGNSILYGHNWPNLLGGLKNIQVGDTVTIIYSDNTARDFAVEYLTKVSPNDTSVLAPSEDHRITLYTCTGFLDSERLVVVANLLKS